MNYIIDRQRWRTLILFSIRGRRMFFASVASSSVLVASMQPLLQHQRQPSHSAEPEFTL
jgi:hypothetical protein